ncbi:class I SAM-dependent methyltransferase [Streptomyces antnestii]|uniref:Class I SAM-dependent methyltransferase n=1 Tax=Streptomyces antnestii TaxID=2494256 RepID=A0A3S3UBV0_9ACTN|nr:class I SAM-dependent methyltransferase [Streptomyces sp. San01]RVU20367.1 class I SAM-dependent methyltransferase [Streptomyces sp. San01]
MSRIVNVDQSQAWNGYDGEHWARHQVRWDAVNAEYNQPLLDAAGIRSGDRVLDVGCGSGVTTRLAARAAGPEGRALGVDLSGPMLARAEEIAREEGPENVAFEQGDVQVRPFDAGSFDVAVSRFGVMFFADPVAAFANIRHALRSGGRLAFVCPAEPEHNDWLRAFSGLRDILPVGDFGAPGAGGPGMFALSDADATRKVLAGAGFTDIEVRRLEVYGVWGRDAGDAASFILTTGPGRHAMDQVGVEEKELARHALADALRVHEGEGEVRMKSVGLLVTARTP